MRKANWVCHILRTNCVLNNVTDGKEEGRVDVTGRRGRRHKQLLDGLEERRGCGKLKDDALDRTVWRTRFGRGCGPVVSLSRVDVGSGIETDVSASASVLPCWFHFDMV